MKSLKEIYLENSRKKLGHGDKGTAHSYIDFYESELNAYRSSAERFLEIGIAHGLSMRMWREFFTSAEVIGIDVNDNGIIVEGCELIYADATKSQSFNKYDFFDIVIDDGSHRIEHQIRSFDILFPKLKNDGVYYIEDVQDIDKDRKEFLSLPGKVEIFDFRKNKNRYDDVIIKITK